MTQIQHEPDRFDPAEPVRLAPASWAGLRVTADRAGLPLDPTSTLYVSLFLVLFAFFAMLNSYATEKQQGADEVLENLRMTFGGLETVPDDNAESVSRGVPGLTDDAQLLSAYDRVISDFPEAMASISSKGSWFEVLLPLDRFFIQDSSRLAPSRELFLKSLAVISAEGSVMPMTIEFSDEKSDIGEQRKVAALAATLGKYGFPSENLYVVGSNAAAGQIRLIVGRR